MRIREQYKEIDRLKCEIDKKLKHLDRKIIKDLIIEFVREENLKKLFTKDNQLYMLNCFCTIWLREQKKLSGLGLKQDIFENVQSLSDVENKYTAIKFGMLRLEADMPRENHDQVADCIINRRISGIALHYIINSETMKREDNMVALARLLKDRGEYATAIVLLQEGQETFSGNPDILLELADCWLTGGQLNQARECLLKISKQTKMIKNLIWEIEKAAANENL